MKTKQLKPDILNQQESTGFPKLNTAAMHFVGNKSLALKLNYQLVDS